jgi:hypothetical protein
LKKTDPHDVDEESLLNQPRVQPGEVSLRVGWDQNFVLGFLGFAGSINVVTWLGAIPMLFAPSDSSSSSGGAFSDSGLAMALGIVAAILLLTLPTAVPPLILRARQKYGARLQWSEEGVVEWDGVWKRNSIPWSRMEVAHFVWYVAGRSNSRYAQDVVQLFDTSSDAIITAWQGPPPGSPVVRRRVVASDLAPLLAVLRTREAPFTRTIDVTRAEDPERRRMHGFSLAIARLGYFGAMIGPMTALPSPLLGVVISTIAAALLAWRATPVLHELRVVSKRMHDATMANTEMPATDPYREASAPPVSKDPRGRYEADKTKRRAVIAEAVLRFSFVVMTLFAGAAMALHPS